MFGSFLNLTRKLVVWYNKPWRISARIPCGAEKDNELHIDRLIAAYAVESCGIIVMDESQCRFFANTMYAPLTKSLGCNTMYYGGERNDHFFETQQ